MKITDSKNTATTEAVGPGAIDGHGRRRTKKKALGMITTPKRSFSTFPPVLCFGTQKIGVPFPLLFVLHSVCVALLY